MVFHDFVELGNNTYSHVIIHLNPMAKMQKKNLDTSPDEVRKIENGKIELANLGDVTIGRAVLEPGWSWEKCVKPLVKTDSCQAPHTQYIVSGRINYVHIFLDTLDVLIEFTMMNNGKDRRWR